MKTKPENPLPQVHEPPGPLVEVAGGAELADDVRRLQQAEQQRRKQEQAERERQLARFD